MHSNIFLTALAIGTVMSAGVQALGSQGGYYSGGQIEDEALPPDFRGRVTYQGTHEGQVRRAGRTREHAGRVTLELTFNGSAVVARFSGTGGMNTGTMTGTRRGNRCRLVDDRFGNVIEGDCTRSRFWGGGSHRGPRETTTIRLEAQATQFVDLRIPQQNQTTESGQMRSQSINLRTHKPFDPDLAVTPQLHYADSIVCHVALSYSSYGDAIRQSGVWLATARADAARNGISPTSVSRDIQIVRQRYQGDIYLNEESDITPTRQNSRLVDDIQSCGSMSEEIEAIRREETDR